MFYADMIQHAKPSLMRAKQWLRGICLCRVLIHVLDWILFLTFLFARITTELQLKVNARGISYFFLFQAQKLVYPSSMSKDFTIWDPAEPNVGSQVRIKGGEEVNVFLKNSFIS